VENAYRIDNVDAGGPLGTVPIMNIPYSVNVLSRQLIDDAQSRNFKEAAKYLPLVSFQEMQGPEVLRPESRGMQGSNMQNDRKDGMGIAVTTPSAMEEYEQVEVITGLGGALYGPANPSGIFNFVTKRPTDYPFREFELEYEGEGVGTVHTDLGGRLGPDKMFGYRTNLLLGDGRGYVSDSELRRQLGALALDVRPTENTVVEGNYSYYNLFQHGYPGWFAYAPSITPSKSILLPVNAPDPSRLRTILFRCGSNFKDRRRASEAQFRLELATECRGAGSNLKSQPQHRGQQPPRQLRRLQVLSC
jgi:iron complex outermembrane receptor protein